MKNLQFTISNCELPPLGSQGVESGKLAIENWQLKISP